MNATAELAFVGRHVLAGSPISRVEYLEADEHLAAGSFFVVSADDPPPDAIRAGDTVVLHPDCLLDDHPEAEAALAAARVSGTWDAE